MDQHKKKRIIIAVGIVVLVISGYFIWERMASEDVPYVEAAGTAEALTVDLTAKVPGIIHNIAFEAGEEIKQGELFAEISRSDLLAQRERDALNVMIARNKLDDLLSGARSEQLKEAQANINIAQAAYDKAATDLERAKALFEEGSLAQAELEVFQNNVVVSSNQLDAAQARYNLLLAGSSESQIQAAQNQVKMLEAVLQATEALLADLEIKSPLDGTVQTVNYAEGEYVMAGASLATIVNLDKIWINVYIPTDDLPLIKLGGEARCSVSGYDDIFKGTITEIATRGEFTPKTIQTKKERTNIVFKVKIEVDNSQKVLKPGMPADVLIPVKVNGSAKAEGAK